eukprot:4135860-Pleurochrysis_carterae.AAC.3
MQKIPCQYNSSAHATDPNHESAISTRPCIHACAKHVEICKQGGPSAPSRTMAAWLPRGVRAVLLLIGPNSVMASR